MRLLLVGLVFAGCATEPWFEGRWSGTYRETFLTTAFEGTAVAEFSDGGGYVAMQTSGGAADGFVVGPIDEAGHARMVLWLRADAGTDYVWEGGLTQSPSGTLLGKFAIRDRRVDAGEVTLSLAR